ncbi:MAG: hypothetical protein QMD94_05165 [Candidatus Omnitrophota bacterium]|nr:hypothetical protein [Candidatus Omnitrophota bacterium]
MKLVLILILVGVVILVAFSASALRKELQAAREHSIRLEERNDKLQRELMRLSRVNHDNEQFLNELEQSFRELENKMPIENLERYIPKEMLKDIKPIIDRLQPKLCNRKNSGIIRIV